MLGVAGRRSTPFAGIVSSGSRDDRFEDRRQFGAGCLSDANDGLDVRFFKGVWQAKVGHDRNAETPHRSVVPFRVAGVVGDDRLWNGRHADRVGSDLSQKTVLGSRFEARPADGGQHPLMSVEVFPAGHFKGDRSEFGIVRP